MKDPTLHVYGPRGMVERTSALLAEAAGPQSTRQRSADEVSVTEIMTRQIVCASPNLDVGELLEVMIAQRLGSVPVVDELGSPIGMVTRLDVIEHLSVAPTKPKPCVADLMMPFAITLDEKATVAHAAALMSGEDMHHVMIVSTRRLVGIVSTMDVTRWVARADPGGINRKEDD